MNIVYFLIYVIACSVFFFLGVGVGGVMEENKQNKKRYAREITKQDGKRTGCVIFDEKHEDYELKAREGAKNNDCDS